MRFPINRASSHFRCCCLLSCQWLQLVSCIKAKLKSSLLNLQGWRSSAVVSGQRWLTDVGNIKTWWTAAPWPEGKTQNYSPAGILALSKLVPPTPSHSQTAGAGKYLSCRHRGKTCCHCLRVTQTVKYLNGKGNDTNRLQPDIGIAH